VEDVDSVMFVKNEKVWAFVCDDDSCMISPCGSLKEQKIKGDKGSTLAALGAVCALVARFFKLFVSTY